jgi:L-threonine kinase
LAASLEPTDSTLFPGLAVFSHRDGQRHELLGAVPPVEVLVLDPGGQVDTVQFNDLDHSATLSRLAADHLEAFALLKKSIATLDWAGVGQAATLSACAHQAILADDLGPVAWRLARDTRSLGVCRAHSGTLWGVLVDPLREDVNAIESYLTRRLPPGIAMHRERLVDGGPRVLTPSQTST